MDDKFTSSAWNALGGKKPSERQIQLDCSGVLGVG